MERTTKPVRFPGTFDEGCGMKNHNVMEDVCFGELRD